MLDGFYDFVAGTFSFRIFDNKVSSSTLLSIIRLALY